MTFLMVSHGFRWAKEPYTREATLNGPFFRGVETAVRSLHGWSDGDDFLTNFVGHPMEGAVAGYIFTHNDPLYREEEFGRSRAYWRGKTRAFLASSLYSLQFEVGPLSEATVGKIQAYWPQSGFVDWAVTPTVGLAWSLAEDTLDEYVVKRLEGKIRYAPLRALLRGGLNPARSFANLMAWNYPWHRDTRPGIRAPRIDADGDVPDTRDEIIVPIDPTDRYGRKRASFSFMIPFQAVKFASLGCIGGSATAQIPLGGSWDAVIDLGGCNLLDLPKNWSGDSLTYLAGVRWSPKSARRLAPDFRVMLGGHKVCTEITHPDLKAALLAKGEQGSYYRNVYLDYTSSTSANGLALSIGGGVELGFNRAVGLRLASIDYLYSWMEPINGYRFNKGLSLSTGLIINVGSW